MEKDINSDVINATQTSLGKYVKRPPLTDKLLKKPPFRFLHDIITSVLKSTGFFTGLFDEEELVSDNVKDRESKILFLNKIITVLSITIKKPLSVKPSKIIAGQEPEKTNELLQCLALALDKGLSSNEAVKQYIESTKFNVSNNKKIKDLNAVKKVTDARKIASKSSDKLPKSVKSDNQLKNDNQTSKTKPKENNIVRKDQSPKKQTQKVSTKKASEKIKETNNSSKVLDEDLNNGSLESTQDQNLNLAPIEAGITLEHNTVSNNFIEADYSPSQDTSRTEHDQDKSKIENIIADNLKLDDGALLDSGYPENKHTYLNIDHENTSLPLKNKAEHVLKKDEELNLNEQNEDNVAHTPETRVSDIIRRPSSSRPGAPRLREKHESIITVAENLMGGKVNIIAEKTINEEEDETTIIIMDNTDSLKKNPEENVHLSQSSEQRGHLVQQILEAQKEFTQAAGKTEIEWHFETQKARDVLNQEIEQIRFNVQALSRVANPLGKLSDHIQEDVEIMRQELHQWTVSYESASKELLQQKVANEEYLLPLYARIKQSDMDIAEKHDKINDLKIIIHKNASRIDKLLSSGSLL